MDYAQQQVSTVEADANNARMEASRADADLQRARLQVDRAQKAAERQTTLNKSGATPKLKYEAAIQEFESAVKESLQPIAC